MTRFAFASYKGEWDRDLLGNFSDAVYLLKLQAQDRAVSSTDIAEKRSELDAILGKLSNQVRSVAPGVAPGFPIPGVGSGPRISDEVDDDADIDYTNFAFRFIRLNPADVKDRLDEIERLRQRLQSQDTSPLNGREFNLLDRLQTLLELEVARSKQSLYAF